MEILIFIFQIAFAFGAACTGFYLGCLSVKIVAAKLGLIDFIYNNTEEKTNG